MAMPRKPDEEKYCRACGKRMHRKKWKDGVLESNLHFHRRMYCDRECMSASMKQKPKTSNPSWMTAHYHARNLCPPAPCEICGKNAKTDVHHKNGNWQDNRAENLVRLCRSCHLKAHRGSLDISFDG